MNIPESVQELINRLEKSFDDLGLGQAVSKVFYDEKEDIVTVQLFAHVDENEFCSFIDSTLILKKNDQIAISRL